MKDQHDCPFCVTVSWSCILFIGTVHTGKRLSVVEHYLFWNSLLLQLLDFSQLICLKIEHHCITRVRKKKKGFEKLCINCQQFRCLSLSWCRFFYKILPTRRILLWQIKSVQDSRNIYIHTTALWAQNHVHFFTYKTLHFLFEKVFFFF